MRVRLSMCYQAGTIGREELRRREIRPFRCLPLEDFKILLILLHYTQFQFLL